MRDLRFSTKLQLALIAPLLLALAIGLPLYWGSAGRLLQSSTARHIEITIPLVTELLESVLGLSGIERHRRIEELGRDTSLRITLIDDGGVVLADSARSWQQLQRMDNHLDRPEVVEAGRSGSGRSVRRSSTTGVRYVYVARTVDHSPGDVAYIRIAEAVDEVTVLRRGLGPALLGFLAALLAVAYLLAWWLGRQLFSPLAEIVTGANSLATGESGHRVDVPAGRELGTLAQAINHLADRTESQLDDLQARRADLEAIVNGVPDGILVTDHEGKARLLNPGFRRLFAVLGDPTDASVLELTRQPAIDKLVRGALTSHEVQNDSLETSEQPPRTLALSASALSDGAGVVLVARDISETVRFDTMRRDFVANVSHELRTPLAAIRGYAETLHDGALEDETVGPRFVGRILAQCQRLQVLLDDLLTLSRLERPSFELTRNSLDLAEIARDAVELVRSIAEDRGVALNSALEPTSPLTGDRPVLERLTINLLENAIKYNKPGGAVTISCCRREESAVLEVSDTGIGIPAEALDRIFERFFRVDKGRSRAEGGTGLGLAIVKHAAHLHGGRVEVESELNQGTTFRVLLPLARPLPAPPRAGGAPGVTSL